MADAVFGRLAQQIAVSNQIEVIGMIGKSSRSFKGLILFGFSTAAYARGGIGGDPSVLFGVAIVFGIGCFGLWLHKTYPNLFPTIGGLAVLLMVSQFLALMLIGLGIVEQRYMGHAMAIIAVAFVFGPVVWSRIRNKP